MRIDPTTFDLALLTPATLFWARDCLQFPLFNLLRLTPTFLLNPKSCAWLICKDDSLKKVRGFTHCSIYRL